MRLVNVTGGGLLRARVEQNSAHGLVGKKHSHRLIKIEGRRVGHVDAREVSLGARRSPLDRSGRNERCGSSHVYRVDKRESVRG